jgi:hypothetical protein
MSLKWEINFCQAGRRVGDPGACSIFIDDVFTG